MLKISGNTHSALDFTSLCNKYHKLILTSKQQYYSNLVSSASANPKRLWQTVNKLLHRKSSSPLLSSFLGVSFADSFASFFTDKISKLHLSLKSNSSHRIHTYCLLLLFLLIFHLFLLLLNLKSTKFCQTVQASNPNFILFLLGFLRNVHHCLFPQ